MSEKRAVHALPGFRSLPGFRWLYLIDAATLFGLMVTLTIARFGFSWPSYPFSHYAVGFMIATSIHMAFYYFGGMYEYELRLGTPPWIPRAVLMTLLASTSHASVSFFTGRYLMPRGNMIILVVAGSILIVVNRYAARRVRLKHTGHPRVLLAGSATDIERVKQHLHEAEPDIQVAGEIETMSSGVEQVAGEIKTVCGSHNILNETKRVQATDILLLSGSPLESLYPEPLDSLAKSSVGVYRSINPPDTLLGLRRTYQIGGMPFIALRLKALPICRLRFKRLLDMIYLLILSPAIILVAAIAAIWVWIHAGKPVIYRQKRIGQGGQEFIMTKFRTMTTDAEPSGQAVLASRNDPRVVKGLNWLRRTRIDELPQMWDVFRGRMSIVGPRPERPELVNQLAQRIDGYNRRHDVPPGITGLAQIQGHYQTDAAYKLGHDLQYIVNWSPVLDWEIIVKSLIVMTRGDAR